ncbi:molybdopterin molybdenumtransferase MoeA [Aeromonas phage 13AhydR10PP]|nr:molybdopterin molybdenumtransferase MoeA [Aeromonas phage 13AhydR10PP]
MNQVFAAATPIEGKAVCIGQEVITEVGQMAKIVGFDHFGNGIKIEFADGSGKTTTEPRRLRVIGELPVNVVVYFSGREKGGSGEAVNMKNGGHFQDMERAIMDTCINFEVVKIQRIFVNDVEVRQHYVEYTAEETIREMKGR